jgi:hypothetical protein
MAEAVSKPMKGLSSLSHEPPKRATDYIRSRRLEEQVNIRGEMGGALYVYSFEENR